MSELPPPNEKALVTVTVSWDPRDPPRWAQEVLDAFRAGVAVSGSFTSGPLQPLPEGADDATHDPGQ